MGRDQSEIAVRRRTLNFATEYKLQAYEAAWLELADRLQLPLLTHDLPLQDAARRRNIPVSIKLPKT